MIPETPLPPPPIEQLPSAMAELVPTLRDQLSQLGEEAPLIASVRHSSRYIQYATFDGKTNLRAETVGNAYLDGPDRLDDAALSWLRTHGWNEPDEAGNHWRHWEPCDFAVAALVGAVTLHLIHGVTAPEQLFISPMSPCEVPGLDWDVL
ncbi:MAG TPA: hypothetical protein VFN21_01755 [Acidimicrobiales bacterium]|nr:hypothetical protein [Acidimicrobiales bacterium]